MIRLQVIINGEYAFDEEAQTEVDLAMALAFKALKVARVVGKGMSATGPGGMREWTPHVRVRSWTL